MKENKALKYIFMVFKTILTLIVILIFSIIFFQRVTNNKFNLGGYGLYTVITESMKPKYEVWDMLLAKRVDPSTIQVGDDVVYEGKVNDFKGKIVTHRVIAKENKGSKIIFATKGINNEIQDPMIEDSQILGKVVFKSAVLSLISLIINNNFGFYFMIFVPIVIIIVLEVIESINERKMLKEETEE